MQQSPVKHRKLKLNANLNILATSRDRETPKHCTYVWKGCIYGYKKYI